MRITDKFAMRETRRGLGHDTNQIWRFLWVLGLQTQRLVHIEAFTLPTGPLPIPSAELATTSFGYWFGLVWLVWFGLLTQGLCGPCWPQTHYAAGTKLELPLFASEVTSYRATRRPQLHLYP